MRRISLVVLVVALGVIVLPGIAQVAPSCTVTVRATGDRFVGVQEAVDAAANGDRLVIAGICVGQVVIDKDLTLVGRSTATAPQATLDGNREGRTMRIRQGEVTLHDLWVTGGLRSPSMRGGAGILNTGILVLNGSTSIRGNKAWYGGGIHNEGSVFMRGSATISWNGGSGGNGGVANLGRLVMSGRASIRANHSGEHVAGGVSNSGTFIMRDGATVRGNRGGWYGGVGNTGRFVMRERASVFGNYGEWCGGIYNDDDGTLILRDAASVHDNEAFGGGGGIQSTGTVVMDDSSSVDHNTSRWVGGGVYAYARGRIALQGAASVTGNVATDEGGGIYLAGRTRASLFGRASVTGNVAGLGGGIRVTQRAVLRLCSARAAISPNDPDDPPKTRTCT